MGMCWTTADDIAMEFATNRATHPLLPVARLLTAITSDPVDVGFALSAVTPESASVWGDFAFWAQSLIGWRPMARVESAPRALDVVYLALVEAERPLPPPGETFLIYEVTVVWRPELGGWRIHDIGRRWHPSDMRGVRTSPNRAPRITRSDMEIHGDDPERAVA